MSTASNLSYNVVRKIQASDLHAPMPATRCRLITHYSVIPAMPIKRPPAPSFSSRSSAVNTHSSRNGPLRDRFGRCFSFFHFNCQALFFSTFLLALFSFSPLPCIASRHSRWMCAPWSGLFSRRVSPLLQVEDVLSRGDRSLSLLLFSRFDFPPPIPCLDLNSTT